MFVEDSMKMKTDTSSSSNGHSHSYSHSHISVVQDGKTSGKLDQASRFFSFSEFQQLERAVELVYEDFEVELTEWFSLNKLKRQDEVRDQFKPTEQRNLRLKRGWYLHYLGYSVPVLQLLARKVYLLPSQTFSSLECCRQHAAKDRGYS